MASIDGALLDLRQLDELSRGTTSIHRLDARVKVLVTLVFILTVVSFDCYAVTALAPFFIFPAVMAASGDLPFRFIAGKIALVLPFVIIVAIFNPLIDREILVALGPVGISGGWISFASIAVRAILTTGAAVILLAVTGFPAICGALARLGIPRVFAMQLLFLYRYLFVLADEGGRAARARDLRSFGKRGLGITVFGSLVGHLLLRTWLRAERIHRAMLARGFDGEFRMQYPSRFGRREILYLVGWSTLFILLRMRNGAQLLGSLATGNFP